MLVVGGIFWRLREKDKVSPGTHSSVRPSAPHFVVTDLQGQPIDSAKLQGKVVLIDFWATWCVPCESEIPHFIDWQNRYAGDGFQVVGFSMDDTVAPVKSYVEKHKVNYPIAMADEKTIAAFGGVLGLPVNILVNRDGSLVAKHLGVTDINMLEREVRSALQQ